MTTADDTVITTQVYQLYINATQDEVWKAITDPAVVARFFHGAQRDATYEVGGRIRSWSPDRQQLWGDDVILEYEPPHRLVHTWQSRYDPEMAAKQLIGLSGVKFTGLGKDGMPIYAGGFFELRPGVWESWMVGSMEGWATHWRHMTKTARWLMQSLLDTGARRLQTSVLASRVKTCEWYVRSLGMVHEGTQRQFGRNGEDVACFSRVKGD